MREPNHLKPANRLVKTERLPMNNSWKGVIGLLLLAVVLLLIFLALKIPNRVQAVGIGTKLPEHLNLTWQHDPKTTQSFTWRTAQGRLGTVVEYMQTSDYSGFPSQSAQHITGTEVPFPSDVGEMLMHEAEAVDLQPGVSYTYRVGSGKDGEWSGPFQFVTAPEEQLPFTFLFVSDTQAAADPTSVSGYGVWGEMLNKALDQQPDARFLLLSGDIVDVGYSQAHWERWFEAAKDKLPGLNMVPTLGNHDVLKTGTKNFRAQFQLPQNGPAGEKELAYSFDYGSVHLAVLNSEGSLSAQAAWLREDMMASELPWKIVAFHRSPYQSHAARASLDVKDAWTPIFDEAGVDLVLTGHDHAYMRSWPLYKGQNVAEGEGTTYVIGGTAGPKFYDMGDYPWMKVKFDDNTQIFSAVTVAKADLTFKVTARDGSSVDSFTIHKPVPGQRYADVTPSHWAYTTIDNLSREGIVNGVEPLRFRPTQETTRAEFTSMLARALHLPASPAAAPFSDVLESDWFQAVVASAVKAGLIQGSGLNHFAPNEQLTRQELAVLLVRAYDSQAQSAVRNRSGTATQLLSFADQTQAAGWAASSIEAALELKLLSGRTESLFAPAAFATRAETARALENLLSLLHQGK
ncbi:S-layer homology domain-containing protein [Paenibacillus sp. WQ 127069]|uniref:S-layer homology domain-containing protein n=1 Tax=Paenibacillus baimaensis TaxID=2982185 RepID=A0ABT2UQL1_9BACL|nr:S-layer homology domain-containing protein [Paenibacillus sp. WQ 127069]MCU6796935.1 S-layer homology domain-containing protein [Paenibacillus sp. WQ 127069]